MLAVLPLAALPASRLTRKVLKRTREGQAQLGQLAGQLQEGLGGLRTIQAFNGQAAELARFAAHAKAHEEALVRAAWARGAVPGLMEVLAAAALAGALAYAAATQAMEPAALLSLLDGGDPRVPAREGPGPGDAVRDAGGRGGRAALRAAGPAAPGGGRAGGHPGAGADAGAFELEDVRFSYGERRALEGLTLELPVGKVTALVGPSGGGKSTLTSLLLRFERPQAGRLLLDGVDADRYTAASVRAQFALVTQEPLLFSGSVLDNLRYGAAGRDARGGGGGGAGGERGRLHPGAARGLRHPDGRARREAERWPAAAAVHRAGGAARRRRCWCWTRRRAASTRRASARCRRRSRRCCRGGRRWSSRTGCPRWRRRTSSTWWRRGGWWRAGATRSCCRREAATRRCGRCRRRGPERGAA